MLTKLMMRDLVLNRKVLLINFFAFLLYFAWIAFMAVPAKTFIIFSAVMVAILPVTLLAREDKFKALPVCCSLPLSRKEIVASRYILSWLIILVSILVYVPFSILLPVSKLQADRVLSFNSLMLGLAILTLFIGFLFPFVLRYGMAGMMIFFVVLQVLGVFVFLLAIFSPTKKYVRVVSEGVIEFAGYIQTFDGKAGFYLLLLLSVVALNLVSYLFSRALFVRREL